jgi:dihydroorotase
MAETLLRNARLTDPVAALDGVRDVLFAGGRVVHVADRISRAEALAVIGAQEAELTVVDADGLWLWPGLVDVHVHFREPGFTRKETLRTGSQAAAAGGYTTVVCEPNTEPPLDSVALARALAEQADRDAVVNVCFKAAMTKGRRGREPVDMAALRKERRVVAFSDDGDPVVDLAVMEEVCRVAAGCGALLTPHCEDSPRALEEMKRGLDPGFRPAEDYRNESNYVERDLDLSSKCGCRIHFSHVSLARSVDAIMRFRSRSGAACTASFEVTPHHLLLCREDFAAGAVPTVNPPLRSSEDREALQQALVAGSADVVASDHAPHTREDKAAGASGLVGLETTLGLVLTHFVAEGRLTPSDAVQLLSLSPARLFRLPAGTLRPGAPADAVLIDPELEWTVRAEEFRSKSRNTAFEGRRLRGRAVATYVAGREVFAAPGFEDRKAT